MKNKYGYNRYFFDKGKFSFDGSFNVAEFEKGVNLYHGSTNNAVMNYEFPETSKEYYKPRKHLSQENIANLKSSIKSNTEKEELIHKRLQNSHSWFGELKTAQQYSEQKGTIGKAAGKTCGNKCILAFKATKCLKLIDMSDPFNVMVILTTFPLEKTERRDILQNFKLSKNGSVSTVPIKDLRGKVFRGYHPLFRFGSDKFGTRSMRTDGKYSTTPTTLCKVCEKNGYDGYVFPNITHVKMNKVTGERIGEVVLCHPRKSLQRNLSNNNDFQKNDFKSHNEAVRILLNNMAEYKTLNVDFHGGNLLEHSVWTALHFESWLQCESEWTKEIPKRMHKELVLCAFLHDIGKMKTKTLYYNVNKHSEYGKNMLMKDSLKLKNSQSTIKIAGLLKKLNVSSMFKRVCAFISKMHWELGYHLKVGKTPKAFITKCKKELNELRIPKKSHNDYIHALIAISAADIKASLPYINKKASENTRSSYYSWIKNRPQVHPGMDAYKKYKIATKGLEFKRKVQICLEKQ